MIQTVFPLFVALYAALILDIAIRHYGDRLRSLNSPIPEESP